MVVQSRVVRRSSSMRRSGRNRRKLVWSTDWNGASGTSIASNAKINRDLLAPIKVAGSSVLGATVIRTLLRISATDVITGAPAMGAVVGLIVQSSPTVTNIDPSTSFGDDWMLLSTIGPTHVPGGRVVLGDAGAHIFWGVAFDIRSKRKIEELNEQYTLALTNVGANTVSFGLFTRTLIALP